MFVGYIVPAFVWQSDRGDCRQLQHRRAVVLDTVAQVRKCAWIISYPSLSSLYAAINQRVRALPWKP